MQISREIVSSRSGLHSHLLQLGKPWPCIYVFVVVLSLNFNILSQSVIIIFSPSGIFVAHAISWLQSPYLCISEPRQRRRKNMTSLDKILACRDIILTVKISIVKAIVSQMAVKAGSSERLNKGK